MRKDQSIQKKTLTKQLQGKSAGRRKRQAAGTELAAQVAVVTRNDLAPEMVVVERDIDSIRPAKRRTRRTTDSQLMAVVKSLQAFGQVKPVLIDPDGHIVAGHVIWDGMRKLGATRIQCICVSHLDEAMLRAYAIADNRLGETGEFIIEELKLEMDELELLNVDLELTGFTLPEIDIIRMPEPEAEEKEPDTGEIQHPIVQPGDLFALGDHLVLCGDALDPASYAELMGVERAQYVFSDPPYNCAIPGNVSGLGKVKHDNFAMAVGEMTDQQFFTFLATYISHCVTWTSPGAVIAACMDWRQIDLLLMAGRKLGLHRLNVAIWHKGSGGMGALLRSAHEMIALFCTEQRPAVNNVQLGRHGRDRSNVWSALGANRRGSSANEMLAAHPTPKPIPLVADAILDVTNKGDLVLDPFLGSGATLMAAHQTGRICRGIELDPKYVEVSLRRWERATGISAIHLASGLTYAELQEHLSGTAE